MNASSSLTIATPDGSGQAVHPDVVEVPGGHLGFRYWMACTPYPFAVDRHENPIVRVSQDGLRWQPVPGAPDPLVPPPPTADWHHADTDLVLHDGVLHVYYITTRCEGAQTLFSVVTSRDGMHWTAPRVVYQGAWGVSPSVVVDRGRWHMWYVWRDTNDAGATSQLLLRRGDSAFEFGDARQCVLVLPGHEVWHLDVIAVPEGYEALVAAFPTGTDPSRCRLFHARSADGMRFVPSSHRPVIRPSATGWDNRMVYRSTLLRRGDGSYRVWYSAASWGMRCGIGLMEGPIDALRPVAADLAVNDAPAGSKLREDLVGFGKYAVSRVLTPSAYRRLLATRNWLRSLLRNAS